jgi:acetyl-CoA synthetase
MPSAPHIGGSSTPAPSAVGRAESARREPTANVFYHVCGRPEQERDRVAITVLGEDRKVTRWTYADLDDASAALAHVFLEELGLRRGDKVGGILDRGAEAFIVALAAWRLGLVYVPMFVGFGAGAIAERLTAADLGVVVVASSRQDVLKHAMSEADRDVPTVIVGGPGGRGAHLRLADVLHTGARSDVVAAVVPQDTATLMFTSGTTGKAKGCIIPHSGWLATVPFLEHVLELQPDDLVLSLSDPGWSYGLITTGIAVLAHGVPLLVQDGQFDVPRLISGIEEWRPTVMTGAPTAFRRLSAGLTESGKRLSLRTSSSGGEPLDPTTAANWKRLTGSRLRDGYGLTELGMVLADVHSEDRTEAQLSALPGFQIRLVDPDDAAREVDQGRLLVRCSSHQLSIGYADAPGAWSNRLVGDGWFLTDDVFRRNSNGRYSFRGRTDDIIVTSGYNVSAVDVEGAIRSHPDVVDVAVTATPAPVDGATIRAAVVLRDGTPATDGMVGRLQDLVRNRVGRHAYPRVIEFVEVLPRTASGKLRRQPPEPPPQSEAQVPGS